MLVCISIYLLIVLGSVLSLSPFLVRNEVKSEARKLEFSLRRAILASSHHEHDIVFSCDDHNCRANFRDNEETIFQHRLSAAVSLSIRSSQPNRVILYRSGTASPATLVISNQQRECSVILSLEARVRSTC